MTQITEADLIRQKMRRIRHKMDDDVEGLVQNASKLMDYHYYLTNYPWATLGAAAIIGYLLVPSSSPKPQETKLHLDPEQLEHIIERQGIVVQTKNAAEKKQTVRSTIFGWLARTAVNAALAYGTVYVDQAVHGIVGSNAEKSIKP
jgi:hypothetical protein